MAKKSNRKKPKQAPRADWLQNDPFVKNLKRCEKLKALGKAAPHGKGCQCLMQELTQMLFQRFVGPALANALAAIDTPEYEWPDSLEIPDSL